MKILSASIPFYFYPESKIANTSGKKAYICGKRNPRKWEGCQGNRASPCRWLPIRLVFSFKPKKKKSIFHALPKLPIWKGEGGLLYLPFVSWEVFNAVEIPYYGQPRVFLSSYGNDRESDQVLAYASSWPSAAVKLSNGCAWTLSVKQLPIKPIVWKLKNLTWKVTGLSILGDLAKCMHSQTYWGSMGSAYSIILYKLNGYQS